jgi:hypothetical protein
MNGSDLICVFEHNISVSTRYVVLDLFFRAQQLLACCGKEEIFLLFWLF